MARSFNGTSDKIDNANAAFTSTTSFTFAAWALSPNWSAGGTTKLILTQGQPGSGSFQFVDYDAANARIGCSFDGSATVITDAVTGVPTANVWYHIAGTWNSGSKNATLYTNGVSRATGSMDVAANGNLASNNDLKVGCGASSNVFFNGSVADAAIWNVELTAREVAALAAGMRPLQIRSAALLRWYPLDGIASPEPDLSGNAKNGTLTGTAAAAGPPLTLFTPRWPLALVVATPGTSYTLPIGRVH